MTHSESDIASKSTLLVVDDNEMNRDMLGRRMQRAGYTVVTAESGREALQAVEDGDIALVLLDIEMPEMSGIEVLERLRRTYRQSELPVIMVTARTDSADVIEALNAGANDYLTKPVDVPVARARIRTQLSVKFAEEAMRVSEERYALAARGSNDGLWDWDRAQDEVYFSPRWFSMLGIEDPPENNRMDTWMERVHPDDLEDLKRQLDAHIDGWTDHFECEHRLLHETEDYRWVVSRGLAIHDARGQATRMAGSLTDVTDTKAFDPLTLLPNRLLLDDRLDRAIARARRSADSRFAVALIDMDRFKVFNDSLGPGVGDKLLLQIAQRLSECVRETDTVAHLGEHQTVARLAGDEFVVLLEELRDEADAKIATKRFLEALSRPFEVDGQEIFTSASAGVVGCSGDERTPADVLRDADTTLHRSKALGGGHYVVFDESMREDAVKRLEMENGLRRAIARDELRLHYQPIVNLTDGEIRGFEALVRWEHPTLGLINPGDFIPIAEETGMIVPIGTWVLREACRQTSDWKISHPSAAPRLISVNLSVKQLLEPDLVDVVRQALDDAGLDPRELKLEITESVVVKNVEQVIKTLGEFRVLGIEVAIDDFGTGYSSFAYLKDLPVDWVKIDRSFVMRICSDNHTRKIVLSIIELAQNLGMGVIAEGVETPQEVERLVEMGCNLCQGFLYSRPLKPGAASELLTLGPIVLEPEVSETV